ncbi:diacylglycerol O-acyltransferase [Mycolicibacterium parafortuitum]|uniref:Diacylglycerol O-acyltransferase n=1 Tax=Mycolicibacterium parafortuitum TaxID=39692 RepID=A0A7I7U8R4_MYCPF|nr:wax ester/triacylglycerol synthase family O-acyltransferase [Mycolicibacterium parafortuitum]BBY77009.1 diacylglycerol O-acyltransferase [Mycolicibacterium parafortuitum]
MERLSAFDAGFLDAEDADPHISLAVGAVSVLEGPVPPQDEIVTALAARIPAIPRLSQVVRRAPFDLSAPQWVADPAPDLAHHIRRAALPHPGDDEALFRFTAEAMESRLDRERPLWQCWVIEGLPRGQWAILMKVHHCIADGIAALHMLTGLCDGGEHTTYVGATQPAQQPRPETARRLSLNPIRWAQDAWSTASAVASTATTTLVGGIEILDSLVRHGDDSVFNGSITSMRRYSAVQVSLADALTVCRTFDVTLNDVALAAITDSFRAALIRRGAEPLHHSLRTLVPVSVRPADAMNRADNQVSVILPYLPVDESDRLEQLRAVHRTLTRVKAGGQRSAGSTAVSIVKSVPFAVASRVIRTVTALPQRGVVALATNVPGPRDRLRLMGHDVVRMLPIPPVALRLRAAVGILSYGDDLVFGITTDFDAFPDVAQLADGIADAVADLTRAAARKAAPPADQVGV